jgi:hypothetical protein
MTLLVWVVGLFLLGPLLQKLNHGFGQTLHCRLSTTAKWVSHLVLSLWMTNIARRWFLAKPMAGFRAPIPFWYPIFTSRARGITYAIVADVVSGSGGLDNPVLLLLVAYQATTEDLLQIDPSDHSPGRTKGATGARVLRVDLVVLWDIVALG